MGKLSCQDILRHGSPWRRGWSIVRFSVDHSRAATRGAFTFSVSGTVLLLGDGFFFLTVQDQHLSLCAPTVLQPPLGHLPSAPQGFHGSPQVPFCLQLSDLSRCPLLFFDHRGQHPMTLSAGLDVAMTTPQSVPPEASARTRCRLMASSRKTATFSLSSSLMKA